MDPFIIIPFGQKIFCTRVLSNSRNESKRLSGRCIIGIVEGYVYSGSQHKGTTHAYGLTEILPLQVAFPCILYYLIPRLSKSQMEAYQKLIFGILICSLCSVIQTLLGWVNSWNLTGMGRGYRTIASDPILTK